MSLNCNEINLILSELNLTGSFIQEIVQPSFDSIAFYTYKPGFAKTVFISLAAGECRIHEVRRKIPKNEKPLRFNEILRSKIKGARIIECSQIQKERIILIKTKREGAIYVMPAANEKLNARKKTHQEQQEGTEELNLYIRLWSNAGNIFLCDAKNTILDSFYRRPNKNETSGSHFELGDLLKKSSTPLQCDSQSKNDEDKFPIREFKEFSGSFNEKVDSFYSESATKNSLESLLIQAEKWYNAHRSKQAAALSKLEEKKADFLNATQWKHQGDLILSFAHLIDGKSNFLECIDYENGKTIRLKIDPKLSAQKNAEHYYETYKKQTSGLSELKLDIESAKHALDSLEKQYKAMCQEKNPVKLEQILRKTQKPKQQEKQERPGLMYQINGWTIFVGRDANENDELLRHYTKGADMWFHTRDFAGGYIFIKNRPGKTIPLEIMLIAGNLAVYHSKARKNAQADLYYTQVKHLRRAKNGPKGLVLPTNEKNLHIKLDKSILRKLEQNL